MGDTPSPPAPETPVTTGSIVAAKDLERDSFVETFHVREKGRRYEVAANAIANRALMQMNVAKLRVLTERAMKPYLDSDLIPSPKDLKTLVEAVQTVDAMSSDAYSDAKKGGALANSLERIVYAATRGAAAGAGDSAKPGSNSPEARLKRLNSIGKKKAPDETVVELDE